MEHFAFKHIYSVTLTLHSPYTHPLMGWCCCSRCQATEPSRPRSKTRCRMQSGLLIWINDFVLQLEVSLRNSIALDADDLTQFNKSKRNHDQIALFVDFFLSSTLSPSPHILPFFMFCCCLYFCFSFFYSLLYMNFCLIISVEKRAWNLF